MKNKFYKSIFLVLSLSFMLNISKVSYAKDNLTVDDALINIKFVMEKILDEYVGANYKDIDANALYNAAMKGMFGALDDYSQFYTKDEYKKLKDNMNTVTYGMGAVVTSKDNTFIITEIYKDSGAEKAGIMVNDQIIKVNNEDVIGLTLDELVTKVKGKEGTPVDITITRNGEIITYTVYRTKISEDPTNAFLISDYTNNDEDKNILYLSLDNFNDGSYDFMLDTIKEAFNDNKNIDSIIFDLRNNGGGYTNEALNIISLFLDYNDEIFTLYDKNGNEEKYISKSKVNFFDKVVVLVNHNSASASEVTTGALKDNKKAIVIGENTFGKNVSQTIYDYNAMQFKLTNQYYLTPSGYDDYKVGITPHIIIEEPKFIYDVKYKYYGNEKSDDILAAKSMLKYLGYNITDESNTYDTNTLNMISKFQADNGLGAYGGLDYTTQRKLNEVTLKKFSEDNRVVDKAIEVIKNWDTYKNMYLK